MDILLGCCCLAMKKGGIDGGPILQVEPIIMWPRQIKKAASGGEIDDSAIVCGAAAQDEPSRLLLPIKQHALLCRWRVLRSLRSLRRLWLLRAVLLIEHRKTDFFALPRQCYRPPSQFSGAESCERHTAF